MTDLLVVTVFLLTYLGMALGRIPLFKLDRTGIALLGVVVLLVSARVESEHLGAWVDLPTLMLLMGLMVISAQFAASGSYDRIAQRLTHSALSPQGLLGLVILVSALLSAFLANDIIAFAMAPMLIHGVRERGLDPRPYLIGLACACNTGSAATLIGNPQNILIAQRGGLDFWAFVQVCAPPALVATLLVWAVVGWIWRHALHLKVDHPAAPIQISLTPQQRWQTWKGVLAVVALLMLFSSPMAKEVSALLIAGLLLLSRVQASRTMLGAVDWHLLLLFAALFIITGSFADTGLAQQGLASLMAHGIHLEQLGVLTPLLLLGSNTIGNVPAVMLLLSIWPEPTQEALYATALLSTLAGNLLLVGSLANIIVAERAASAGVMLGFREHARCGIPITLLSLVVAVVWLLWQGTLTFT